VDDATLYRQAWGKFATGVAVITTIQPDGQVHGMTAQGIASVSLDPMLVLVCVGHNRNTYPLIQTTSRFCINVLNVDQQDIAEYFASPPEQRAEDFHVPFKFTDQGSATIDGSLTCMDCHVVEEHVAGDHTVFIGEINEIIVHSGRHPLLYFESKFGRIAQ